VKLSVRSVFVIDQQLRKPDTHHDGLQDEKLSVRSVFVIDQQLRKPDTHHDGLQDEKSG
jgi:alkyl hydroperoxide reductase subunit AhpC